MNGDGSDVHPLLAELAREGVLLCPRCRESALRVEASGLRCSTCRVLHPARHGVVDLFGLTTHPAGEPSADARALARRIADVLALDDVGAVTAVLHRAEHTTAGSGPFDAEIHDLADRFGVAGPAPDESVADGQGDPGDRAELLVERHYVPAALPLGARVFCNVRFHNAGTTTVSSLSDPPVTIRSRWGSARLHGHDCEARVRLPLPLLPGRSLTIPVPVDVPRRPGRQVLEIGPDIEGRPWSSAGSLLVDVEVVESREPAAVAVAERPGLSYADEHVAALEMFTAAAAPLLARPKRRLLEIGGGASPQLAWLGHDLVNVDISLPLLELGSLWYATHADRAVNRRVAFLAADACALPFPDGLFDAVVMFATLHHFPTPEILLTECRRLMHPDGLVAVLCEPVSTTLEAADVLRDLRKGINEQVFSVDEYVRIARAAGLAPVEVVVAGGSLRMVLRRGTASGERFDVVRGHTPADAASTP